MFRTPTGQTGKDAYVYEAAQIANAQRDLDDRFQHLRNTVEQEQPDLFESSTDFLFAGAKDASHFVYYLKGEEKDFLRNRGFRR